MSKPESFEQMRADLVRRMDKIEVLSPVTLKPLERDFKKLIEVIIFSMLKNRDNYFGNFVIQMNRKIDYTLPAAAAVGFRDTYFDFLINPVIFIKQTKSIEEMTAIVEHECYHVMNQHIKRAKKWLGKVPFIILNLGADASINQFIPNLPDWVVTPESLKKYMKVNVPIELERESEYYIELLIQQYKDNEDFKKEIDDRTGETLRKQIQDMIDKGEIQETADGVEVVIDEGGMHAPWEDSDDTSNMDKMKDVIKGMINKARDTSRGTLPGKVQELIDKLNEKPIIPWQTELKNMVATIPVPYKKTITRRDRRQPSRLDIKGRLNDREVELIIGLDTSGSMSDQVISYCMNETFHIVKNIKSKVTIVECDAEVGRVYEAKDPKDVKPNVTGRGGTRFSPVFEWIKENKRKNAILIYFTDGYGESQLSIKPYHHDTIWVLTEQGQDLSVKGVKSKKVKQLELDKKWKKLNGK